ncbi:hypothetical protein [Leptodesmis sp.]|uniref:hypothetical protein n=1 Tax=Leptodesmis sp. TaxID=3100501 RepID=UPI0040534F23
MRTGSDQGRLKVKQTLEHIFTSRQMTRQQHLQLASLLLCDRQISQEERLSINRLLHDVQTGTLKLVN